MVSTWKSCALVSRVSGSDVFDRRVDELDRSVDDEAFVWRDENGDEVQSVM